VPLFHKNISLSSNVQLWDITEPWTDLIKLFDEDEEINSFILSTKNDSRKQQFLASSILLKNEFGDWKTTTNGNGKPYPINNSLEISITHERGVVGLIKSTAPCGIDIQEITPKVIRVKNKFINKNDIYWTSEKEKDLTVLWCAKETLYKINGDPNIFFKEHMIIEESDEENILIGKINHPKYRKYYKMKVHFIQNYCLVYTF